MAQTHATPEATQTYFLSHPAVAHSALGNTALLASRAGFGGYRISTGVLSHKLALKKALTEGINLVDTSSNYADGNSERLIGQVIGELIDAKIISRNQVIVVSKVGYLQGDNYDYSQQRKAQGKPFKDLVDFGEGLEHCIHPEFIEDQLQRSLERLGIATIDFYLLHNPEYYLEWAVQNQIPLEEARTEFYRRIRCAFEYLEGMVTKGRIQYYGVSSNTLPAAEDDPQFTSLSDIWETAVALASNHHFRLIQMPLNLLEPGAVLENNQPGEKSVLEFASERQLAVLINRPLNAFDGRRLARLTDVEFSERFSTEDIIDAIRALSRSEKRFLDKLMSDMNLNLPLQQRVREQLSIGDVLKHHWRHFGSFERWREVKSGHILARVQGVMDFLAPYCETINGLDIWMESHSTILQKALNAVESIYSESAAMETRRLHRLITAADPEWADATTLSQRAIRAIRSTAGVSSVLVGMRREEYVTDVLLEMARPISPKPRHRSWKTIQENSPTL